MSLDPAFIETSSDGRKADRFAELERRVARLETAPTIQTFTGSPTSTPRDGTPGAQTDTPRFWLRIGGVWRFVALT